MSKNELEMQAEIMKKIDSHQIKMRPKWYFIFGTISLFFAIFSTAIISVFLVSLISFSLRQHGPNGEARFNELVSSFPWWALIVIFICLIAGAFLLKKFDFSYRKNFWKIILIIVLSIILSGVFINIFGLDKTWMHKGAMKCLYSENCGNGSGANQNKQHGWRLSN